MERTKRRTIIYGILVCVIFAASLLLSVFRFPQVFTRTSTAVQDLILSLIYYFAKYGGVETYVTVTEIPYQMIETMPMTPEEFAVAVEQYFAKFWSVETLTDYLYFLRDLLANVALNVARAILPTVGVIMIIKVMYDVSNNDYGKETVPLRIYKVIEKYTYCTIRDFLKDFFAYWQEHGWMIKCIALLWLYNLNVLTIVGESFAFLFYVCMSLDWGNIFVQGAKLIVDASVAIDFLPGIVWLIIGWIIFDKWRRKIGLATLRRHEAQNREFIENHPGALFITGKQRAKKTTILVDMLLSIMSIHKERAHKSLFDCDMEFPNFTWINLELFMQVGLANGTFCAVAHIQRFYKTLKKLFYMQLQGKLSKANAKSARRWLKKEYGYQFDDFIFGYEWERYGIKFDNELTVVDVFDTLEDYAKLYYVYASPTPLMMANLSIRTDTRRLDLGNFPLFDDDFFEVDACDVEGISEYCHVLDYDGLRLGKTFDEKNARKLAIDVGAVGQTEMAKERLNQHTRSGMSSKSAECNQLNDLYEMEIKMHGHVSTIRNYTYFQPVLDDQREGSLSGENADLCDKILVKRVSDAVIVMPFFEVEETLYLILRNTFEKFYYKQRYLRGDNTLLCYLLKKLFGVVKTHYVRVFNQFSVYKATIRVENGMTKEVLENNGTYWISTKKTYSDRFATDAIADFYYKKHVNAEKGINQVEQYTGKRATVQQMKASNSHFYKKLFEIFGDSLKELTEDEIAALEKEVARKYDHSRSWLQKKTVKVVKDGKDEQEKK